MARIRVSASRPSRLTKTATETLSTESRFTTERRGDRGGTGFQNNLASESPDGRGARCDKYVSKPGDCRVTRQHNHWTSADLGHLAPPHLPACGKRTHEALAAGRHDARSPHSSG